MSYKLKPCPFCGSKDVKAMCINGCGEEGAEYEGQDVDAGKDPWIHCFGCDTDWFTNAYQGDEVIEAWNRRANDN